MPRPHSPPVDNLFKHSAVKKIILMNSKQPIKTWFTPLFAYTLLIISCATPPTDKSCGTDIFQGKLVVKGICLNYVIEVIDGNIDQTLIEKKWEHEFTKVIYNNVFALGSVCDFPETIREGDTFRFALATDPVLNDCAVCEAYSPTPDKKLNIKVCD